MGKGRIEYENLIRSSALFTLDRTTQAVAYKREALKMVEYLYQYLMSINAERYCEFGLEITQTANSCIKNYSPEIGDFLNYFNSAFAKEYRKSFAQNKMLEQHGGVHIPEQDQRIISKFIKLAETQGSYELSSEQIHQISAATGIQESKICEYIQAYQQSFSQSDSYLNDDGEEGSLFDMIASEDDSTNELFEVDQAIELLRHVDEVFEKRQQRQKPLLSKLITAKIVSDIAENESLLSEVTLLAFFYKSLFSEYRRSGTVPTAREIASQFGISEQSVSRTYKTFISLL